MFNSHRCNTIDLDLAIRKSNVYTVWLWFKVPLNISAKLPYIEVNILEGLWGT
jgi:hypothetical protein